MIGIIKKTLNFLLGGLGAIFGLIVLVAIPALILFGIVWISEKTFEWLSRIFWVVFLINILVFIPLTSFKKTKSWAGQIVVISSYFYGITLWVYSALLSYHCFGLIGLLLGLVILGIGVFPVALAGTIILKMWEELGLLLFVLFVTFSSRAFGLYKIHKSESEQNNSEETSYDF